MAQPRKVATRSPVTSKAEPAVVVEFNRNNFGPPDIAPEELVYIKKIGGGCYGAVYEGVCRGEKVAIKKLFKQDLGPASLSEFKKEVELCSRLTQRNVLLFMGACTVPGEMAIVTELCERGNLETLLHNKKAQISLYRRILMAKDTATGMAWLHGADPQIIHRDIKPSNLLVDKHGQIKVCDFGLSALKPATEKLQDKETIPGTPLWMSPEVLTGKQIDEKTDVYSFSIVLWEIVTQQIPFPDIKNFRTFRQDVCLRNLRPPVDGIKEESIQELLAACWDKDSTKRPSFIEIIDSLNTILVDTAIKDKDGRLFWKHNLLTLGHVPFEDFLPVFCREFALELPEGSILECMKLLLSTEYRDEIMKPIDVVKIEDFGKFLQNFGPIRHTRVSKSGRESEITIIDRMTKVCKQSWFHGDLSSGQAESLLRSRTPGTYLVRLSSTVAGCFTISRITKSKTIGHHRIDYVGAEGFVTRVGKTVVRSNKSLSSFISSLKPSMNLIHSCPGSKYHNIFKETTVVDGPGVYEMDVGEEGYMDA